ncbi:MAG: dihydrolipoyl dehydrogenase [Gemmatimonadetes bacterium]|nr:dihydrolipoyl dehydrogenase [Gemmatimonadota bacterium]
MLGGGSGGYAAARTAREDGADVAIVDPGPLGGLCILRGCMPSKALLASSGIMSHLRRAEEFGIEPVNAQANLEAIMARKDRLIAEFTEYRVGQLRTFPLYDGYGRFVSADEIDVDGQRLRAKNFIIATGSVIRHMPIPGLEEVGYMTSDEALELRTRPDSMIVLGGGSVACELAQFYCRVGVDVTLIQRSHHILSSVDEDLARPVETHMREEGMKVFTGTKLHRFWRDGERRCVSFAHEGQDHEIGADVILQALGRRPNIDRLDLEAAGVQVESQRVLVDKQMRTSQPHIFAVGDVNGFDEIVHVAILQGEAAAFNAMHPDEPSREVDDRLKLVVTFTDPAVATVGMCEQTCQAEEIDYLVACYPFDDHGKSLCMGEIHGQVKLLCEPKTGELLGASICGPEAGELIHELAAVMHFHGTVHDLLQIPHYHPTLAEIITYPAEELVEQLQS